MTLAYTFSTAVLHPSKACYCDTWLVLEPRAGFGEAEGMLGGREGCDGQMLLEPAMPSNGWKIVLYEVNHTVVAFEVVLCWHMCSKLEIGTSNTQYILKDMG